MARKRNDFTGKLARFDGARLEGKIDSLLQPFWGVHPSKFGGDPSYLNRINAERLQGLFLSGEETIRDVLNSGAPLDFSENLRRFALVLGALARLDPGLPSEQFNALFRKEVGAIWQKVKGRKK